MSAVVWSVAAWSCSSASESVTPVVESSADGGDPATGASSDASARDAAKDARADQKGDGGGKNDAAANGGDAQVTVQDGSTPCSACAADDVAEVTGAMPTNLFVDATDVYFSYHLGRYINKAPKTGGTMSLVAAEPSGWVLHLAGDATHLYVVNSVASAYRIDEVAKTGGAFRAMYQSGFASSIDVDNFVVDTNVLYLAAGKNAGGTTDLLSIDKTSAVATPINAAWSPGHWLAASGSNLFWSSNGHVYQAAKNGSGSPTSLAWPGSDLNGEIAADGADVFYGFQHSVELHKVTGATDVVLNANQPSADFVWGPIVDANDVYVIASDTNDVGTIYRVARAGGTLQVFADQQQGARGLAQDATHVYWATLLPDGSGSVVPHIVRKAK